MSRILETDLGSRRWGPGGMKNEFYKAVMSPVQTSCKLMKKIGTLALEKDKGRGINCHDLRCKSTA